MKDGNLGKAAQNFFLRPQAIIFPVTEQDKQKRILPSAQ